MTEQGRRRTAMGRRRLAAVAVPVAAVVTVLLAGCTGGGAPAGGSGSSVSPGVIAQGSGRAPSAPTAICGQPVLNSSWHYDGAAGTYTAGNEPGGLPTFGSAKSDFPDATKIIVVPAGDNTAAASAGQYNVNHAVFYFEPGRHKLEAGMFAGHNSAYVGGYTPKAGHAVLDGVDGATNGTGKGGSRVAYSTPSSGNNVYNTWEYLTVENFTSSQNNSVLGNVNGGAGGSDNGDTYKYDTIGPNEYGYAGDNVAPRTGESNGGGYAIDAGSNTTIEYNCLTRNAQGAFNVSNGVNLDVEHNEISWNGLGEYPDSPGPGGSPFGCGCSGGGKVFFSLNTDVVDNYVHNNYNTGIWFDFDNAGAQISGNYIASNWGSGIAYEASYNAGIFDNTLVGNGWASDGPWPAGIDGKACYGGVSCANGDGPVTGTGGANPYAAIDLSDSGGNTSLGTVALPAGTTVPGCQSDCTVKARYSGRLAVTSNVLQDNFGGVKVYTDTNRYPGNVDNDSACSVPLGVLNQANSALYYRQSKVLVTTADATITGTSVTSAGGTKTICADYGTNNADADPASTVQAPSPGMAVYNQATGAFLGNISSVSGAQAFTLTRTAGNMQGVSLLLSAYGGCGPADYYDGGPTTASGTPRAEYWSNCKWGAQNVTVSGNVFSINANAVQGCQDAKNLCGYMENAAFNAGVPRLFQFWDSYPDYIARASGGLGNVWSDNRYLWSGKGSPGWQFWAGKQTDQVTLHEWLAAPYGQDRGSTFSP
jgi:hypothetical protein